MKRVHFAALLLAAALLLSGCGGKLPANTVHAPDELSGKTVGVLAGSVAERSAAAAAGEYGKVIGYYSDGEMAAALLAGTIDCAVAEDFAAAEVLAVSRRLRQLRDPLCTEAYTFAAARENADLIRDVNTALAALREEGVLDDVTAAFRRGEIYAYTSQTDPETARGTLTVAVSPGRAPYQYVGSDGQLTGIEITVARMVCDRLNCNLEFHEVEDDRLLLLVQAGLAELAVGCLAATEENAARTDFSDAFVTSVQVVLVRK